MVAYDWFIVTNGALYVLIAAISCPLHCLVSYAMIRTGTVKKRITLRMLLSLSCADVIQLLCHGIGGLSIVLQVPLNDNFNGVLGFLMNGLWATTLIQHVSLALNRLKVVSSRTVAQEAPFKYFDISIVVAWGWGIFFTLAYTMKGDYNLYFDAPTLNWAERTSSAHEPFNRFLFWFRLGALTVGLAASSIVIFKVLYNRSQVAEGRRLLTAKDLRLFAQTTIVFLLAITHVASWNLTSDPSVPLLALLNMEWVLVCALMPWLNITMSADIRSSLFNVLKLNPQTTSRSTKTAPAITIYGVTPRKF